jgi:hypothetical protein
MESLLTFLKENARNGNLVFGKKDDFINLENKFIIIIDENKI